MLKYIWRITSVFEKFVRFALQISAIIANERVVDAVPQANAAIYN